MGGQLTAAVVTYSRANDASATHKVLGNFKGGKMKKKEKKIAPRKIIIIIIIPVDCRDGSREFTISRERNAAKKEVLI